MKHIKTELGEPVYTLDLTESEVRCIEGWARRHRHLLVFGVNCSKLAKDLRHVTADKTSVNYT